MKNRCVIVGGADINGYERVKSCLQETDFLICCDSGLKHRKGLGITPSLIVGDFDSYTRLDTDIETIVLPCEKDDTDTVFAVKEGLKRGFSEFLLVGVVGARLDHTLGNLYILQMLDALGKRGTIIDDYSWMELVSDKPAYIDDSFSYFSVVNITGCAREVSISHAKYPLTNAEIPCGYQYGISNEVLPGQTASVTVGSGKLLLIKVW